MSWTPIAFSPASITGFFVPQLRPDPWETVSPGLSFCLEVGVTAALTPASSSSIALNGATLDIPPVRQVIRELAPEPIALQLESPLPLGCGFGLSAAGALTAAWAINHRFGLGHSRETLGKIAHIAEVSHWTGVGDVAAQLCGGVVWRRCRQHPLDCEPLAIDRETPLYYRSFGPLSTPSVLRSPERAAAIAKAGTLALEWLEQHHATVGLEALIDRARTFADDAGLITQANVRDAIDKVVSQGGHATMAMLGQTVLASQPLRGGVNWTRCRIDPLGTRIIA